MGMRIGGRSSCHPCIPLPSTLSYRSRKLFCYVVLFQVILFFIAIFFLSGYHKDTWVLITFLTRPLWDTQGSPFVILPHFYAEGIEQKKLCELHKWTYNSTKTSKVIDAILFSNELDLLEIRLRELYPVVDKFFIVESDKTFTDNHKTTEFQNNKERFAFAQDKIIYGLFKSPGGVTKKQAMSFYLEDMLRDFMTDLLEENGLETGDYVIVADVDEIPSRNAIALAKFCDGFPPNIHLGLRNYLYSFEFPLTHQAGYVGQSAASYAWRPFVRTWERGVTKYDHSRQSDFILADAGWHCSSCFRYIEDFIFKMTSFSHSDRVRHESFLDEDRIQRVICDGANIFDEPPDAFSFYDLMCTWPNLIKTQSVVHLPAELVAHPNKYSFLLPGNCIRKPKGS